MNETEATKDFIYECVRFTLWGIGEGLAPPPWDAAMVPDDIYMEYQKRTSFDQDWDKIPEHVAKWVDRLAEEALKP